MPYREDLDMVRQLVLNLIERAKLAYDYADVELEEFVARFLAFYDAESLRVDTLLYGHPNPN